MLRSFKIYTCTNGALGLHLSRAPWDPYPWVSSIQKDSNSYQAGLRIGDCLLELNGQDVLGMKISEIAALLKNHWLNESSNHVTVVIWRNKHNSNGSTGNATTSDCNGKRIAGDGNNDEEADNDDDDEDDDDEESNAVSKIICKKKKTKFLCFKVQFTPSPCCVSGWLLIKFVITHYKVNYFHCKHNAIKLLLFVVNLFVYYLCECVRVCVCVALFVYFVVVFYIFTILANITLANVGHCNVVSCVLNNLLLLVH